MTFGGARASLFKVTITNPVNPNGDSKMQFMAKTASLPGLTVGTIEVPYLGRKIKIPGDRTYEPWEITVINDEDFLVRNALEEWNQAINSPEGNISKPSVNLHKSQAKIEAFGKDGSIIRVYEFSGIWPSVIGPIEMSWESSDTIQEFATTFEYDYFTVENVGTGDAGGR